MSDIAANIYVEGLAGGVEFTLDFYFFYIDLDSLGGSNGTKREEVVTCKGKYVVE